MRDMKTGVKICPCDGSMEHARFEEVEHIFPDGSIELLPTLCPENELLPSDLFEQYKPILETLESNEEWTNYATYSGQIAEVSTGLYFYSFGDTDEVGESNFYFKSELKPILEELISDWGTAGPAWREFLKSVGEGGYPKGYQPSSMVDHIGLIPKLNEEGLFVGFSYNTLNSELIRLLKEL